MRGISDISSYRRWYRLFNPTTVGVIAVRDEGKESGYNLIPLIWVFPLSARPPILAISVSRKRYSHRLLLKEEQFSVSILPLSKAKLIDDLGETTGAEIDKVKAFEVQLEPGVRLDVPHIRDAMAWLEVERQEVLMKDEWDHDLFIGLVRGAFVRDEVFDTENLLWAEGLGKMERPAYWLGDDVYGTYEITRG